MASSSRNRSKLLQIETALSLSSVTFDVCNDSVLSEQHLRAVMSDISFRHVQDSSALQSQGGLSLANFELTFRNPHEMSLLTWQSIMDPGKPGLFISGTWTVFAMDWEVSPFHLRLPLDVLQFFLDIARATLPASSATAHSPHQELQRECHRVVRTVKVMFHKSSIGFDFTPVLDSVITLEFENAFVLQAATQTVSHNLIHCEKLLFFRKTFLGTQLSRTHFKFVRSDVQFVSLPSALGLKVRCFCSLALGHWNAFRAPKFRSRTQTNSVFP